MLMNIKYLLFDLDGTLLKFDLHTFIRDYLRLIQNSFSCLPSAKSVPEWIMGGTDVMLNSLETITNKDKFLRYFQTKSGLSEDQIWEIFLHFDYMYACKSHKAYFEHILKMPGTASERCLMIGNDVEMNMAVKL